MPRRAGRLAGSAVRDALVCGLGFGGCPAAPGPRASPRLGLGSLVPQGGQPVGQVPGQGLEQAGQLLHRGGQGPGQTSEQDLARRQICQGGGLPGVHDPVARARRP